MSLSNKFNNLISLKVSISNSDGEEEVQEFKSLNDLKKSLLFDLGWNLNLNSSSKGNLSYSLSDKKWIRVEGSNCFSHFFTNRVFTSVDFRVMFEVSVSSRGNYLGVGIYNSDFDPAGSCVCGAPKQNMWFLSCDGTFFMNGTALKDSKFAWNPEREWVGMHVYLSTKKLTFFLALKDIESQSFDLTGDNFRVFGSTCKSSEGTVRIMDCISLKAPHQR